MSTSSESVSFLSESAQFQQTFQAPTEPQKVFDVVTEELNMAIWNCHSQMYFKIQQKNDFAPQEEQQSPKQIFLNNIQKKLVRLEYNEAFFSKIYDQSFNVGKASKGINHISHQANIHVKSQDFDQTNTLTLWINLDKLANELNHYFGYKNRQYKLNYKLSNDKLGVSQKNKLIEKSSRLVVNGIESPSKHPYMQFLLGLITGIGAGSTLIIASLALASVLTLSTTAIAALLVTSIIAGMASYSFFKNKDCLQTKPSYKSAGETPMTNLDELFTNHFSDLIAPYQQETLSK